MLGLERLLLLLLLLLIEKGVCARERYDPASPTSYRERRAARQCVRGVGNQVPGGGGHIQYALTATTARCCHLHDLQNTTTTAITSTTPDFDGRRRER